MTTLTMTRDRVALLRDISAGKVWRTASGKNMRKIPPTDGNGFSDTIGAKVGELVSAGW